MLDTASANLGHTFSAPQKPDSVREPRSLSVLWIVEDDISYHGLPILLKKVPSIRRAHVRHRTEPSTQFPDDDHFDIWVVPPSWMPDTVQAEAATARPWPVILTLSRERQPPPTRTVPHWTDGYLYERDLTLEGLRSVFDGIAREDAPRLIPCGRPLRPLTAGTRTERFPTRLTDRERAVLQLLVRGASNQQIASTLQMSIHGAKRHVSNLLIKFNCANRTELALTAVNQRLVAYS